MENNSRKSRAEARLKIREAFLRESFEASLSSQVFTDPSGKLESVNRSFLRTWGYSDEDKAIGRPLRDFIRSREGDLPVANFLEKDGAWEGEFTGVKQNGDVFRGFGSVSAILDNEGKRIGFQASFVDLTDKKKAEEGRLESEEMFKVLFEGAPDAIFIADTQKGGILDANKAACRLLGRTRAQVIGMNQQDLFPPEIRKQAREVFFLHVAQSQSYGHSDLTEMSVLSKNGTVVPVEIHAQTIRLHRETVLLGTFRDISDRKNAEEELRRKQELISSINNNLVSGMVYQLLRLKDGSRKFTYLSDSVKKMYGVPAEKALRDPELIYSRVHDEDREKVIRLEEEANRDLSVFKTEVRLINPDGSMRWSSFVSNPTLLADGSTRWDGIEMDITERKRAEEKLAKSEELVRNINNNLISGMVYQVCVLKNGTRKVTYASESAKRLYGVSAEVFMRDNTLPYSRIVDEDRRKLADLENEAIRSCSVFRAEVRMLNPDGSVRWSSFTSHPTMLPDGSTQWDGVELDITDRKEAEDKLRESELKAKAMLEAIPDMMFRLDRDGVFIDYKAQRGDLYYRGKTTFIGKKLGEILPREMVDLTAGYIAKALETGDLQTYSYELPIPEKGTRKYEARMVRSGENEVTAIVRDITDRKKAGAPIKRK